ncbi:helix-turn-helix domain-containing protein [Cryobacterium sp. BB307]|uniref:helix-turn-helix domain-containing protein n=1 Tax=Cryobacterium sp. BB307 TaxID=2716317 RepID=UPI001445CBC9|nr:helix-turn-helix domain-containing protein [Cryobacterium sp. BB307]
MKTSPEVEAEAVRLIREGQTRREVAEVTGVSQGVLTRIVRDTPGLDWARTGSGSSGTPEAAAKARGFRSKYMRDRREAIADKMLDQAERSADLAANVTDPRQRQYLMQAADAALRGYANVTKPDILLSEQESMQKTVSMFDTFTLLAGRMVGEVLPPARPGLIQE